MHRGLMSACLVAGLSLAVAAPAQAQSYKLLAGWAANNVNAYWPGAQFAKNLGSVSGGKATVTISGPEAVPPFEQMQPVSAGAFDIIYTHPSYHSKGLAGVAEIIPFDLDAWRSSGVWDCIDKFYQKTYNVKLLALVALGTEGYHCYLRAPLSRGRRLERPQAARRRQPACGDQGARRCSGRDADGRRLHVDRKRRGRRRLRAGQRDARHQALRSGEVSRRTALRPAGLDDRDQPRPLEQAVEGRAGGAGQGRHPDRKGYRQVSATRCWSARTRSSKGSAFRCRHCRPTKASRSRRCSARRIGNWRPHAAATTARSCRKSHARPSSPTRSGNART